MKCIPFRYILMIVLCAGTINLYSQRMCMSIAVLCMTNHTAELIETTIHLPENTDSLEPLTQCSEKLNRKKQKLKDGPFHWDGQTRAHVLGMFFWGYLVGQIPAGFITQMFGARRVNMMGFILLGLSTGLIPVAAVHSIYLLYFLRVVAGLASAFWFPGFYQIWASWAPPNERGLLIGLSYAGVHIGNAVTLPIAGGLCQTSVGWPLIFYFYGVTSLVYGLVWVCCVYDTPTEHPRITDEERKFIVALCEDSGRRKKQDAGVPLAAMLRSLPVWAFVILIVGYDWNGYTMLTSIPVYMKEVLLFDIDENAGLSALPYIGLWIGQLVSGWISDIVLAKKLLNVNVVRRLMTAIGMFGPGITMILISLFDCRQKYVVVCLFTFGLILNSGLFAGGMLNPIEMSPKHSGIIFAIANTVSSLTGVLSPLLVSWLTPHKTYYEWRYVFYVGAAIYFCTGAFFVLFSSTKLQPWANSVKEYWSGEEQDCQVLPADNEISPVPVVSTSNLTARESNMKSSADAKVKQGIV